MKSPVTKKFVRPGDDYIDHTIATVRNHRDADNCWPQWANIFADEIEWLRAERDVYRQALTEIADEPSDFSDLARIARAALAVGGNQS